MVRAYDGVESKRTGINMSSRMSHYKSRWRRRLRRSYGRLVGRRSRGWKLSGARREPTAADEHVVGRTTAARSAALHSEQPDVAGPMASARASRSMRTPAGGSISLLEPGARAAIAAALADGNPRGQG
jgi:hypothetical protein